MPDVTQPTSGALSDEEPDHTQPIGPTNHLNTVDYWRGLYLDAIEVTKEMIATERAKTAEALARCERAEAVLRLLDGPKWELALPDLERAWAAWRASCGRTP